MGSDQAGEEPPALGTLQREDRVLAGAIAWRGAEPGDVARAAAEEPPAILSHVPDGGVVEDTAVLVEKQRVRGAAGLDV